MFWQFIKNQKKSEPIAKKTAVFSISLSLSKPNHCKETLLRLNILVILSLLVCQSFPYSNFLIDYVLALFFMLKSTWYFLIFPHGFVKIPLQARCFLLFLLEVNKNHHLFTRFYSPFWRLALKVKDILVAKFFSLWLILEYQQYLKIRDHDLSQI